MHLIENVIPLQNSKRKYYIYNFYSQDNSFIFLSGKLKKVYLILYTTHTHTHTHTHTYIYIYIYIPYMNHMQIALITKILNYLKYFCIA